MGELDELLEIKERLRLDGVQIAGRAVVTALWWADKAGWGEGPWQAEPDKVHWIDPQSDLDCLAVRHESYGHWCGYVGVPPDHPLHGVEYGEIVGLEAHRGVNFSNPCQEPAREELRPLVELIGVCHAAQPGRPEHVFWLGFDCGHAWDYQPGRGTLFRRVGLPEDSVRVLERQDPWTEYRTLDYVMAQCEDLARQLKHLGTFP